MNSNEVYDLPTFPLMFVWGDREMRGDGRHFLWLIWDRGLVAES